MYFEDDLRAFGADWISAPEAVHLARASQGPMASTTWEFLIRRAANDLLLTRCRQMRCRRDGEPDIERRDVLISPEFWDNLEKHASVYEWSSGDFERIIGDRWGGRHVVSVVGVQFSRRDLVAQLPQLHVIGQTSTAPKVEQSPPPAAKVSRRSKNLVHDHPFAAAMAALELAATTPISERDRLTGPSIGKSMEPHYRRRHKAGAAPDDDSLDDFGASVLAALNEFWANRTE